MSLTTRRILFLLFFLSGLSSLVYQVVWTRMAFAAFGIITPVLSVVLSVFMLGLALGSWAGGQFIGRWTRKTGWPAVIFYGLAEFVIGLSAFAVPRLFAAGEQVLLATGETNSVSYLVLSALVLAVAILPWCVCMGATFPLMMAFVAERDAGQKESFSFLYLANVLGAMCGTLLTAVVWVETFGFRHTLWLAAAGNFTIALISGVLALTRGAAVVPGPAAEAPAAAPAPMAAGMPGSGTAKWLLFSTGFVAMAMEVVWTRAFTPVLKTQVYTFALIVFTYLGATFAGSWIYRRHLAGNRRWSVGALLGGLAAAALLPVVANDTRLVTTNWLASSFDTPSAMLLMFGICPFCALLGYLTPSLIDAGSAGRPERAGKLYTINVLGCILGPLFACYVLLPNLSERYALILLSLPMLAFQFRFGWPLTAWRRLALRSAVVALLAWSWFVTRDFESMLRQTAVHTRVRRDYAASVISFGEGTDKRLLVNGVGMTTLTPITKLMVHLPLAFHQGPSQSALIICFGMGTSYRSALSWDVDTTVVELVPGVVKLFGFFHADAEQVIKNPRGHIVIDDGRRFLQRTTNQLNVIVVDPPPPIEAAGSSLLFSKEFYQLARQHLKPGGILQMWFPGGDNSTGQAVVRSAVESFPHVRCFASMAGIGVHILASVEPIEPRAPRQVAARLPESAKRDLMEWQGSEDLETFLNWTLTHATPNSRLLNAGSRCRCHRRSPVQRVFPAAPYASVNAVRWRADASRRFWGRHG